VNEFVLLVALVRIWHKNIHAQTHTHTKFSNTDLADGPLFRANFKHLGTFFSVLIFAPRTCTSFGNQLNCKQDCIEKPLHGSEVRICGFYFHCRETCARGCYREHVHATVKNLLNCCRNSTKLLLSERKSNCAP